LYWWNPLTWAAWREFLKMRERAADDLVLDTGTCASEYAHHLLEVARSATVFASGVAAVAMAQSSRLEGRLMAILDGRVNRKSPGRAAAVVIVLAAIALVAPVAAIHAQDTQTLPADVDATIRVATSEKNFEMLDRVAAGFIKVRQYDTAQKVLEAALAIRSTVAGEGGAVYAEGLVKLGDLALPRNRAKDYYEKAVALGDRPATAPALLYLGIIAFRTEPAKAIDYLQRSVAADSRASTVAEAMAWMGNARQIQGDTAEAESLLSRAASMETGTSPSHALVMEMWAHFLGDEGRKEEAEALQARSFQIRQQHFASLSPKAVDNERPLRIGGETKPPTVASKVEPEYTLEARVAKIQGEVIMNVVIGTDGTPGNMTLHRGAGYGLDEKAIEAVTKWRFHPGTKGGVAVPVIATIQVNFRLL
jgi:TonB family protein